MWIFSKLGHISLGQHDSDHDVLVAHAETKEDITNFVTILDGIAGRRHEVQETTEGNYRFLVMAQRAVVAEAVSQMVTYISYGKLHHACNFDFGAQPGYLLWVRPNGLQVAAVRQ